MQNIKKNEDYPTEALPTHMTGGIDVCTYRIFS
jgi:hypothetical protein